MKPTLVVASGIALLLPQTAMACATCFGDPSSPQTQGANMAIFFMLGVIGAVLALIVTFAATLVLRARRHQAAGDGLPALERRSKMELAHE